MTSRPQPSALLPLRLQERPAEGELAAWDIVRSVEPAGDLPELSAARILNRILAQAAPVPSTYPRWAVAVAAVALSLLCLQVAAAAIVASVPSLRRSLGAAVVRAARRSLSPGSATTAKTTPPALPVVSMALAPEAELLPPAPLVVPATPPLHVPLRLPRHSAIWRKPARITAIAGSDEAAARVMETAARQLYADHDPGAALGTLEPYLYLHPEGSLRSDMVVAAVQANLLLDRTPEALGLLDGMATQNFEGLPRASELRLLRAELLARSGRCGEARPVFEDFLGAPEAQQRERALYGRAACRAQGSDVEGSRADLRAYLRAYPTGRFASEARQALGDFP